MLMKVSCSFLRSFVSWHDNCVVIIPEPSQIMKNGKAQKRRKKTRIFRGKGRMAAMQEESDSCGVIMQMLSFYF